MRRLLAVALAAAMLCAGCANYRLPWQDEHATIVWYHSVPKGKALKTEKGIWAAVGEVFVVACKAGAASQSAYAAVLFGAEAVANRAVLNLANVDGEVVYVDVPCPNGAPIVCIEMGESKLESVTITPAHENEEKSE